MVEVLIQCEEELVAFLAWLSDGRASFEMSTHKHTASAKM
jgi:hypothetical protein